MVQSTPTKLPLDRWRALAGMNPLQFWGVAIAGLEGPNANTDSAWFQHSWQHLDAISREELAQVIAKAEQDIENLLKSRLLPSWEADEWHQTVRPTRPELYNLNNRNVRGQAQTVDGEWGNFITGGIQQQTLVEAGAAIVYTNTMLPATYNNLATVVVTVDAGQDPQFLHVYYPGQNGDQAYEIRPITASVVGTTATITFRREMAVVLDQLTNYVQADWRPVEGTDDANFLTEVDVYLVTNNPATQVTMLWNPPSCSSCGGGGCTACAYTAQTGCLQVIGDPRQSILGYTPAEWDADTEAFTALALAGGRQPDIVRLWYLAGIRDMSSPTPYITMPDQFAQWVAILAAARLDREPPDRNALRYWMQWSVDLAYQSGGEQISRFNMPGGPKSLLNNPLGTRRGEVYVWNAMVNMGHGQAVPIGHGVRMR